LGKICRQLTVALIGGSPSVRTRLRSGIPIEGMVAPMGVMKRVTMVFRAKANKALDRMEDPRETLDYSYQTQLELLQKVRRGVADVATSRKRVELQINQLQQQMDKYNRQAKDSLAAGREDLAREALTRKAGIQTQLDDLRTQYESLQAEEEKLSQASQRLQAKVDAFRTRKETIKATYTAAEAQTRINEAFSGISEEMGDVGLAIQRAEDKTAQMRARAGALDELMASGALDDMVGGPHDDIQAELDRMGAGHGVDRELEQMKAELAQNAPRQIESTPAGSSDGNSAQSATAMPPSAVPAGDATQAGDPE
jgi:phage shock protein A